MTPKTEVKYCKLCGKELPKMGRITLPFCNISHQIQFHVNKKMKEHEEKYHD